MSSSAALAKRLREVVLDGRWVANTNFKDQLSTLSLEQALMKVGNHNSIAALTFHVDYYIGGVLHVLEGGTLDIHDKYSFDLPELTTEHQWQELLTAFWLHAEQLARRVELLTEDDLIAVFVDERYGTLRRNIDGIIEHAYYHLGQISLLRKLL